MSAVPRVVEAPSAEILVLAVGNALLSDDGAGLEVLRAMERRTQTGASGVRYLDGGTLSFTLAPEVEAAHSLLILDAARFGMPPGAVRCWLDSAIDAYLGLPRRSVHEIGIRDVLDMARLVGRLPARRALIGIEPEKVDWGDGLSPAVAAALPQAAGLAARVLECWIKHDLRQAAARMDA